MASVMLLYDIVIVNMALIGNIGRPQHHVLHPYVIQPVTGQQYYAHYILHHVTQRCNSRD